MKLGLNDLCVFTIVCFLLCLPVAKAGTDVFFSSTQTATAVSGTTTTTTIRSGDYEFTYSVDGSWAAYPGGPPTGRFFSVFWPTGIQAQAITAGPTSGIGANITIKRIDGNLFDLQSFTGKLLANTAGAGGAFEIMPKLNGEDALNDPLQYLASGYGGQSFSHAPNLKGYESYKIHLWVDFALTALTLNHTNHAMVSASSDPPEGGNVSGEGTYPAGDLVVVSAFANPGYVFVNWTEAALEVSDLANYEFTANENRTLVAHFAPAHTIDAMILPGGSGSITGTGDYAQGSIVTLVALPDAGYAFTGWSLNGAPVSASPSYTFTPNSNMVFDASFELIIPKMSITQSVPGMVVIEWPDLPGWQLEESFDMSLGSWLPSMETVEVIGDIRRLAIPTSTERRFFRLSHP